jgi:ring-1,2-phenylacetyl-CoA epoxidase subunit PaaE
MLTFHPLRVSEVRAEASDGVCIEFDVPDALRDVFRFAPGQHVGVRANIGGQEVRRTYSICSDTDEPHLRIGVRVHEQGSMSRYLSDSMRAGDVIEVMAPAGRFFLIPDATAARTYSAFAAGSGITPILGIIKNVLRQEPGSRFLLFYGNRTTASIMFAEELMALKDRYMERLSLHFILSREPQDIELFNGRVDAQKVAELSSGVFDASDIDAYFLCGPTAMMSAVRESLLELDVDPARIHSEHFASSRDSASPAAAPVESALPVRKGAHVTVVMDGRRRSFSVNDGATTVLEAAEQAGLDLPYSCRAGVCSTCRARVTHGHVTMKVNYALEPPEVQAGYVLCCQALPASTELELNYDER